MNLQELHNLLKTRSVAYVNISDTQGNAIRSNIYFKDLSNYNNDISVLLQELSRKYDKVIITPRLRNGSSSKAYKKPLTVILKDSEQTVATQTEIQPKIQPQTMTNGNFMGLNAPQILDAFSAQRENALLRDQLQSLNTEYATTKADRDSLLRELHEVKRKNDLYDYHEKNDKPSAFDKLIEGIAANPNALTSILGMVGNRGSGTLNASQPVSTKLEGSRSLLQDVAEKHPENYCQLYVAIINRMNSDENFAKLVNNELKKQSQNE